MKLSSYLLPLCIFCYVAAAAQSMNNDPQVKIANGILEGTVDSNGIYSFKGIPFAQPPVGNLRWKAPQPVQNWKGVRMAKKFGPQAMQLRVFSDMVFRSNGMSEDCLYLNVWAPANAKNKHLPVLVYFYGGGYLAGDGSEPRYDGESMARKGIVAVTVNYRLGVFGFFAYPELTKESAHHASGNYGLLDQHAALEWVHKNIAAFGGDPNKVTIGGESAGSMSVSGQMASPLSKGLFRGVIGESGALLGPLTPAPLGQEEQYGTQFAKMVGATSLAQLRAIPAQQLLEATTKKGTPYFGADVDGYFFPETPTAIFKAGKQMHVPLLAGTNSAEVDYHFLLGMNKPTVENYEKAIRDRYGKYADDILKLYPATNEDEVMQQATGLSSDMFIVFATWQWIHLASQTGHQPVYHYIFSHVLPPTNESVKNGTVANQPKQLGARHASEIEFALGNLFSNKVYDWQPDDYKVSQVMEDYFANFIKTGNPNGNDLPNWPELQSSHQIMNINVDSHAETPPNEERYLKMEALNFAQKR